jgi:hypothetical protein
MRRAPGSEGERTLPAAYQGSWSVEPGGHSGDGLRSELDTRRV